MASNIVYIARDIERALGKEPISNYYIITNDSPYAQEIKIKYPENIFLIKDNKILDTYELLTKDEVKNILNKLEAEILVFKNTIHIEEYCKENNYRLLNPSAKLSEEIENKISQITWLEDCQSLLPPYKISETKDIIWEKKPLILQWSHGHTGEGTVLIKSEEELNDIKSRFPYRQSKITEYIKGPMLTINIIITEDKIRLGNISYQITGILPFTENPFSTIGNDWSLPHSILTENKIKEFEEIAMKISDKMQKSKWKGLFGIDVIYDEERDKLSLIEINARQPASTTFESKLQSEIRNEGVKGITVFEAHLFALTNKDSNEQIIQINDGAQILQRMIKSKIEINTAELIKDKFNIIEYSNTKPNSDLFRIQSSMGIMEAHNKFNKRGKKILENINIKTS